MFFYEAKSCLAYSLYSSRNYQTDNVSIIHQRKEHYIFSFSDNQRKVGKKKKSNAWYEVKEKEKFLRALSVCLVWGQTYKRIRRPNKYAWKHTTHSSHSTIKCEGVRTASSHRNKNVTVMGKKNYFITN